LHVIDSADENVTPTLKKWIKCYPRSALIKFTAYI